MVTTATKANFGDYQCNAALPLAKPLGIKPRDAATKLIAALDVGQVFEVFNPALLIFIALWDSLRRDPTLDVGA